MNRIFRLALSEWTRAKTWLVLIALFLVALVAAPLLTPYEVDASLAAPARGQVVYAVSLLIALLYAPSVAAEIGRAQTRRGHRLYWRALGVSDRRYYAGILAAAAVPLLFLLTVAGVLIGWMGSPDLSRVAIAQAMTLTALAGCVSLPLAIGLAQRTASTVAAFFAVALNLAGIYGPAVLDYARRNERISDGTRRMLEAFYAAIPHLRIGDQSERITFAWPVVPLPAFALAAVYLVAWIGVIGVAGYLLFRKRSH